MKMTKKELEAHIINNIATLTMLNINSNNILTNVIEVVKSLAIIFAALTSGIVNFVYPDTPLYVTIGLIPLLYSVIYYYIKSINKNKVAMNYAMATIALCTFYSKFDIVDLKYGEDKDEYIMGILLSICDVDWENNRYYKENLNNKINNVINVNFKDK